MPRGKYNAACTSFGEARPPLCHSVPAIQPSLITFRATMDPDNYSGRSQTSNTPTLELQVQEFNQTRRSSNAD